jgi:hypothetical protein
VIASLVDVEFRTVGVLGRLGVLGVGITRIALVDVGVGVTGIRVPGVFVIVRRRVGFG